MVIKWSRLDWAKRRVLIEAAWNLTAAHVAIRLLPFRWIAPSLGSPGDAPPERPISQVQQIEAKRVGWAIMVLARYFPLDAKCLSQAVAGKWMLHRRGLTSTFYLGVERIHGGEKWLEAHAWLRCGSDIVTGERHHERFRVLAAFTEDRI